MGKPVMSGLDSRESMAVLVSLAASFLTVMVVFSVVFVDVGRKLRAVQKELDEIDGLRNTQ